MVAPEPAAEDGRSMHYRLTEKGIALAPAMLELLIWGAHHEQTDAPCAAIEHLERNRAEVLAETYRRWKERDPEPILPPFTPQSKSREEKRNDDHEYLPELPR